jgi:hypothetical protein
MTARSEVRFPVDDGLELGAWLCLPKGDAQRCAWLGRVGRCLKPGEESREPDTLGRGRGANHLIEEPTRCPPAFPVGERRSCLAEA